jgi:hypothetical protein
MNLEVKEDDVLETLELISERLGYEDPKEAWKNFSVRQQQILQQPQVPASQQQPDQQDQQQLLPLPQQQQIQQDSQSLQQQQHRPQLLPPSSIAQEQQIQGRPGSCVLLSTAHVSALDHMPSLVPKGCSSAAAVKAKGPASALPWFVGGRWLPPDHPLAHIETRLRHGGHCDVCG